MKEVACKLLHALFRRAEQQRIPLDRLLIGIPYSLDYLRAKQERIEWSIYVDIMDNASKIWTDQEFIEIGAAFTQSPLFRYASVISRLFFSARDFYRWLNKPGSGGGTQLFSCMTSVHRETGPNHIVLEMHLPSGYRHSRACWLCNQGALAAMPQIIGLKRATVTLEETEWGARFDIVYPKGGAWLALLKRAVTWPFAMRRAARELRETNEALQARYQELDGARNTLALQAKQLGTTHAIGEIIQGDLDLNRTISAIARSLVEAGGFVAAEVLLSTDMEGTAIEEVAREGAPPDSAPGTVNLVTHGRSIGALRVWPAPDEPRTQLLASVTPAITMALDNALAYRALFDYQQNLERKVADRTTELRDARDELAGTVRNLQEAQAARDKIFANVNHEIRTPLSMIELGVKDIRRHWGDKLDERARGLLDGMDGSARKLLRLIDEMLLIAAGQEQKLTIHFASRDLATFLRDTVTRWQPSAELRQISLVFEGPEHLTADLDEAKIDRVVTNLLSNALKFTPSGGSVQVELSMRDGSAEVAVRDTGIGIDDEFRRRIFQRFEQGRPAVHPGARGSGIGLSLCKELVEAHGGAIAVESPRTGGTIFRFSLPCVAKQVTAAPALLHTETREPLTAADYGLPSRAPDLPATVEPHKSPSATVLVAEDEPALRDAITRLLAEEYRVLAAPDGLTALRLAREHFPDLLVSDVGMPGMDGLELTRRFRELPGNRIAPVILLTAMATRSDRMKGFEAGAIDYVTKPFDADELMARVQSHLAMRALALKLHQAEKLASLGTLSAGLAHELRNPANGIVNAFGPLMEQLPPELRTPESPVGQLLDVMRECADQIGYLSRQLLGFKREGTELDRQEIDGRELIERAIRLTHRAFQSVELKQELVFSGRVRCATPLMVQVLTNLLENGAHAAGAGGWVRVSSRSEKELLIIEVTDSGPGVPAELKERIFEPFFTTKAPGSGTGLGLTTAREIAQRHGGSLDVRDLPKGSAFRLELPLVAPTNVAQAPPLPRQGAVS